jgi:hypothetical protein
MGGEWGWCAPFGKTPEDRRRFTAALARADISAVKAIRQDFPDARMVHIDPLIWVVPPRDRPDLAEAAHRESYDDAYLAWDVISGLKHPEYGGSPEVIDILGLNNYSFGQMELRQPGPHCPLEPGDDRIRPLCDLIEESWKKYRRPCIVAETSGLHGGRPDWLNDVVSESLAAVNRGVDLHGVCLFPAVDMTDWHTGEWLHMGIADVERLPTGALMRTPFVPYVEALRTWQRRLRRVTELDEDPFDQPVNLEDVVAAATGATTQGRCRLELASGTFSAAAVEQEVEPRAGDRGRAVGLPGERLDIGHAVAEALDLGGRERVAPGAAAHVIDGDGDRLHHNAVAADRALELGEGSELEQPGDRAAVQVAGAADDIVVERHHQQAVAAAVVDSKPEQLGVRRKRCHQRRFSGCIGAASALVLISADDAEDEGGEQRELHLSGRVLPAEIVRPPAEQRDEYGECQPDHALPPSIPLPDMPVHGDDRPKRVKRS